MYTICCYESFQVFLLLPLAQWHSEMSSNKMSLIGYFVYGRYSHKRIWESTPGLHWRILYNPPENVSSGLILSLDPIATLKFGQGTFALCKAKNFSVIFLLAAPFSSPISCSYELSSTLNPISNYTTGLSCPHGIPLPPGTKLHWRVLASALGCVNIILSSSQPCTKLQAPNLFNPHPLP